MNIASFWGQKHLMCYSLATGHNYGNGLQIAKFRVFRESWICFRTILLGGVLNFDMNEMMVKSNNQFQNIPILLFLIIPKYTFA